MPDLQTVKERLICFLKANNMGQRKFEMLCGLSNGYVNNIRVSIQPKKLQSIALQFPDLNTSWLLTGEGFMLKSESQQLVTTGVDSIMLPEWTHISKNLIPLYDMNLSTGLSDLFIAGIAKPIDYIYIPNVSACDGAIYVRGETMTPYLQSGDLILFKRLKMSRVSDGSGIFWGDIHIILYTLDGEDITALKYVRKADQNEFVTLANYNTEQANKDIPLSSIKGMALVKAGIKYTSMY